MDRRRFLKGTGGLGCGLLFGCRRVTGSACESALPPGVQLFTVRAALSEDPIPVFQTLGAIGLEEVELFGLRDSRDAARQLFGLNPAALRSALEVNGLRAPLAHIDGNLGDTAAAAELAHAVGAGTLVMGMAPDFMETSGGRSRMVGARSLEQLDRLAERLNRLGSEFRAHGLGFGYHNHHVEFLMVDGHVAFDYLMEHTDPTLVQAELDIGWLALAGMDFVEYMERYRGRVVACHLKDYLGGTAPSDAEMDVGALQARLVEPGAGSVDFARVLEVMRATGVRHGFVEIDVSPDPLQAVARGHAHLRTLQGC